MQRRAVDCQQGRSVFAEVERWQTDYLPVYVVWATLAMAVFPPVFGFA